MMKTLLKRFEAAMAAVAFAEAGEFETARELLNENGQRKVGNPIIQKEPEAGKFLRTDQLYGEAGK